MRVPIGSNFGMALVLTAQATGRAFATLDIGFARFGENATRMSDGALEALRSEVPAARSLPLLRALAREAGETVVVDCTAQNQLHIAVAPCN